MKKIILKAPEYWHTSSKSGGLSAHAASNSSAGPGGVSEIVSAYFTFKDFFKAFKIIAKIGYRNVDETSANKFSMLTQHMKKQLDSYLAKNQISSATAGGGANVFLMGVAGAAPIDSADSRSAYSNQRQSHPQVMVGTT